MFKNTILKRVALVAASALAIGGISAVSANALPSGITTPSAATQTLGAITRTGLTTWSEPVTFNITSTGLAAGQTVVITEANSGTSTATNVVASAGTYTLTAGDVASATSATFTTTIVYSATAATPVAETAALGTQILTPTVAGFVGAASAAVTVPGNPNLQATIGTSVTGSTATQVAGPANLVSVANYNATNSVYYVITGGITQANGNVAGSASGVVAPGGSFNLATTTVGTITVTGYMITAGMASLTPTDTVTVTVIGALPGTVYASSRVYAETGAAIEPSAITDAAYAVNTASSTVNAAEFSVSELDANGVAVQAAYAKPITVSVTNAAISSPDLLVAPVTNTTYIAGTPVNATSHFFLSGWSGLAGTAVITISVNGVVVKTYSAVFSGPAVKIVLTAVNPVIAVGSPAGVTANTNAIEVQEFDASGNLVAIANPGNIVLTPANGAVATAGAVDQNPAHTLGNIVGGTALSTSITGFSLNGLTAGSTTFTATDSSLSLTSNPVTVRVSSAVPTSVVFTSDAATYTAGGNGTITATVSDANGTLPAGTYTVLVGLATSSLALATGMATLPGATIMVNDAGIYKTNFNAPLSDGTVSISATPATNAITVTPVSFTVSSGATVASQAAADAAAEAIDAANAATDAANAAADSADAATAAATAAGEKATAALVAVTALSVQVSSLVSKVNSLAVLLAKIAKKVKA